MDLRNQSKILVNRVFMIVDKSNINIHSKIVSNRIAENIVNSASHALENIDDYLSTKETEKSLEKLNIAINKLYQLETWLTILESWDTNNEIRKVIVELQDLLKQLQIQKSNF